MSDPESKFTEAQFLSHFTELGRFISMYGLAEAMLRRLLRHTVGIDDVTALAIFSGTRTDQASAYIRRCYEARGTPLPEDLAHLLQHMAVITNLRNDLVHHGIDGTSQPPVSTNRAGILNIKALRETVISDEILLHASWDCGRMMLTMASFFPETDPEHNPRTTEVREHSLRIPWHYKPQSPQHTDRQDRKRGRPKRTPPPQSSPE